MEAKMIASAETTQAIHNEYKNIYTEVRCFKGTFSLQVKDDEEQYQAPPRCIPYVLK